jgi:pentatricopeptide repeat protein
MMAEGVKPNLGVFNALIWVCGETKDMDGAFRTLKEMGKAGVPPDVRCYSRLLRACGVDDAAKRASVGASGGGGGGAEGMSLSAEVGGKKTALFEPFIYKMHYFTKTGSGQS